MRIPSIEELKLQIIDRRTRASIDEVLSCFYSGNLRGTVVMLYVTVVSDLYYKICDLTDIYNDLGAREIKERIENSWEREPNSPKWEKEILDLCHTKNKVLTSISYTHAKKLQEERHLCAHPIIDIAEELYHPNTSNVQGMIIDMLRGILCRPAFLGKMFFSAFIEDIKANNASFASKKELVNYIEQKYLNKINNKEEEYELFKTLWKFVFKLTDTPAQENRLVNVKVLSRLYERNEQYFNSKVQENKDHYANNICTEDSDCLKLITMWFNEYQTFYKAMSSDFHLKFESKLEANEDIKAIAFCTSRNPIQHYKQYINDISFVSVIYIYDFLKKSESESIAIDFIIELYGTSSSFNRSDACFEEFIDPMLAQMSKIQILEVIRLSNKNYQIYGRNKFSESKNKIKEAMNKFDPNFDYSPYNHFKS